MHTRKKLDEMSLFIAISFYLFIAILCAKMSSVYKALNGQQILLLNDYNAI